MAYLTLARKYRPKIFPELVGQQHIVRILQKEIETGRIAQSYLFTGARGVGKTSTARILAKSLNCENGPTILPCLTCASCAGIAAGTYPDVIEIDAASHTGVENVRETIIETTNYPPMVGRYKIFIIDEVHMLSSSAFNALLKTIEEPPSYMIFVLATTELHKVPLTIRSRCQEFDFRRLSVTEIVEVLKSISSTEGFVVDAKALTVIAREADGSMRDGISILDQVLNSSGGSEIGYDDVIGSLGLIDSSHIIRLADAIVRQDVPGTLAAYREIVAFGLDAKRLLEHLMTIFKSLAIVQYSDDPQLVADLTEDEFLVFKEIADKATKPLIRILLEFLVKFERDVTQSMISRLVFEVGLLRMASLASIIPFDHLFGSGGEEESLRPPVPRPAPAVSPPVSRAKDRAAPVGATGTVDQTAPAPPPQALSPHELLPRIVATIERDDKNFAMLFGAVTERFEADSAGLSLVLQNDMFLDKFKEHSHLIESVAERLTGSFRALSITVAQQRAKPKDTKPTEEMSRIKRLVTDEILGSHIVKSFIDAFDADVEQVDPDPHATPSHPDHQS